MGYQAHLILDPMALHLRLQRGDEGGAPPLGAGAAPLRRDERQGLAAGRGQRGGARQQLRAVQEVVGGLGWTACGSWELWESI